MVKEEIKLNWFENMGFEADVNGHKILVDVPESGDVENCGPILKSHTLVVLKVVPVWMWSQFSKKMRIELEGFNVVVN